MTVGSEGVFRLLAMPRAYTKGLYRVRGYPVGVGSAGSDILGTGSPAASSSAITAPSTRRRSARSVEVSSSGRKVPSTRRKSSARSRWPLRSPTRPSLPLVEASITAAHRLLIEKSNQFRDTAPQVPSLCLTSSSSGLAPHEIDLRYVAPNRAV